MGWQTTACKNTKGVVKIETILNTEAQQYCVVLFSDDYGKVSCC